MVSPWGFKWVVFGEFGPGDGEVPRRQNSPQLKSDSWTPRIRKLVPGVVDPGAGGRAAFSFFYRGPGGRQGVASCCPCLRVPRDGAESSRSDARRPDLSLEEGKRRDLAAAQWQFCCRGGPLLSRPPARRSPRASGRARAAAAAWSVSGYMARGRLGGPTDSEVRSFAFVVVRFYARFVGTSTCRSMVLHAKCKMIERLARVRMETGVRARSENREARSLSLVICESG